MAAATTLLSAPKPSSSTPYSSPSHHRINHNVIPQLPSSSRSPPRASGSSQATPDIAPKGFSRLRTSLEQSIRTATRSRKSPTPDPDEFATITAKHVKVKGKVKVTVEEMPKEKEKMNVFEKLGSKVTTFRRIRRESLEPSSPLPPSQHTPKASKGRAAGATSYITPSLRMASMSSPALHLSSQALPSPRSQPAVPASSSSSAAALVSPTRERARRSSLQPQPPEIGAPLLLAPKRDRHPASPTREPSTRHRATKSHPQDSGNSVPVLSMPHNHNQSSRPPVEMVTPPGTPTPIGRGRVTRSSSIRPALAHSGTSSPTTPRPTSPLRARSPPHPRVVTPTNRGFSSSSATHLPSSSPSPPLRRPSIDARRPSIDAPRRPSIDAPRRPSIDSTRRPSIDIPRRPSIDAPRRPSIDSPRQVSGETPRRSSRDSPIDYRAESPTPIRPRPTSPAQRAYTQNRHYGISSASLTSPYNPEHREQIRKAASMICKEMNRPPFHVSKSEQALRDWEEVEARLNSLTRLERIWGMSSVSPASNLNMSASGVGPSALGVAGEERERRVFCESLRDGFVLCQLMNKLRSSTVVRPDPKEDGLVKTSNVTRFLAACASYGLPQEDLFQRDDLIEGTSESLARVAHTVITLMQFVETPAPSRIKWIKPGSSTPSPGPYMKGSLGRASASTPNLLPPLCTSPTPSSPRKRYSPPAGLPPLRSDSSEEGHGTTLNLQPTRKLTTVDAPKPDITGGEEIEVKPTPAPPPIKPPPPPKSPLRARSSKRQDRQDDGGLSAWAKAAASPTRAMSIVESTRASVGNASFLDAPSEYHHVRQSIASIAVTDTTLTTQVSSILDNHNGRGAGGYGGNRFGTIRTITTDLTSEAPSMTRAEGSVVADELAKGKMTETPPNPPPKFGRERKASGTPAVDLTRVAEEPDESVSSKENGKDRGQMRADETTGGKETPVEKPADKIHAVHLHKAKWPDDFMEAFQLQKPTRHNASSLDQEELSYSPLSVSPPRKLAIVGAGRRGDGSNEPVSLAPRRPTHFARHSVDNAPGLLPKASILRRDTSPDGGLASGAARVMLRRHSTKPSLPPRTGSSLSRNTPDDPRDSEDNDSLPSPVPFPRTVSADLSRTPSPRTGTPVSVGSGGPGPAANSSPTAGLNDKPRLPRGRFQSEINGSSTRGKPRPNSYDELGEKPSRTRIESMVNLGRRDSAMASASDLMALNSVDGSAVRKTLVVREEGKPPTHFQLGECIGKGQFGSVYRALNLNTGQMVAVKRIRLEGLKEDDISTLMREVDLVRSLSHPSIVKYEGMARDEDTLSIVLEYAENGSLAHTLKAFGRLNERLVASYVVKILEGLHYLHQCDVVHCDLKAANILTTKNGNVKLSDFGVSLNLRAMERQNDVAGTPNWMAPEVIELKGASTKSDIWSLACTVIELLTGRPPYGDVANSMTVMFRIVEDDMPPIPEGCSELLQDFLEQCFNKDPSKRPSAELLCEHPWLKKNWVALKDLRPQDSIPFLRRVSADFQKSNMVQYLSKLESSDSPTAPEPPKRLPDAPLSSSPASPSSPIGRRTSNTSIRPLETEFSPREHNFVKTTFSKPVACRVCSQYVKKTAVLCAQCSLISHTKCAPNAPPTCDLRSQLLLYAHYAETGNPASLYSNPLDTHPDIPHGPVAMSDVPYVTHTPRSSVDTAPPPAPSPVQYSPNAHSAHPPTAFRFMAAFRRSRSNLSTEPASTAPSPAPPASSTASELDVSKVQTKDVDRPDPPVERAHVLRKRPPVLQKRSKDRPRSYASNSTGLSSLRSAATAAESVQSGSGRVSQLSNTDANTNTDRNTRLSTGGATSSSHDRGSNPKAYGKGQEPAKKSTPMKVVVTSGAMFDTEANDIAELSTASSVLPGSLPMETSRRSRSKREQKQTGNCVVQ